MSKLLIEHCVDVIGSPTHYINDVYYDAGANWVQLDDTPLFFQKTTEVNTSRCWCNECNR